MDNREELLGDLALLIERYEYIDDNLTIIYEYNIIGNNRDGDYNYNVYTFLLTQLLRKLNHKILHIEKTIYRSKRENTDSYFVRYETSIHQGDIEEIHIYYDKYNVRPTSRVVEIHKD
jgi:hypothetical protein